MTDPAKDRQLQELAQVELCVRILSQARNELALSGCGFKQLSV